MTKLLEIKERVFRFIGEYEIYMKYAFKFLVAVVTFTIINENVGFMESISTFSVALLLSLVCCLLPQSVTLLVAAGLIIANLYVLSMEVAITAALIFVLIFFLYFRFAPQDAVLFVLTPICFVCGISYVLPIATGLLRKKYSIAAVGCGTIVYYFINGIYQNVTILQATSAGGSDVEKLKMTITAGQILTNEEMYLTIVVFALSCIVVSIVHKMIIDHAWKVAIASGVLVQISGFFVGYMFCDITDKTLGMILGNVIALLLGMVIEFIFMDLDYSRTERVQFEDDDYYYFVKAVPKKMVASAEKEIIQFSGFTTLDKIKERRKQNSQTPVSRQQIVDELDIDDEFLD